MPINFASIIASAIEEVINQGVPAASQDEAVTGTDAYKRMTPLAVKQSIAGNAASPEQGAKADSAVQPEDLSPVATSGAYDDLEGLPTLGSAAGLPESAFATAGQGLRAETSLQKTSTRATMVALDTTTDKAVYLSELEYEGDFVRRDYANYSDAVAADTFGGFVARSTIDSSKVWVRNSPVVTNKMCGAKLDGTNDYAASLITFNVAKALKLPFVFSPGETLWDLTNAGPAAWDPTVMIRGARRAIPILGASLATTSLRIISNAGLAWNLASTTDWFDLNLKGFTVRGSFNGPLLTIGRNDYADPVNMVSVEDVSIENGFNGDDNEALRLNYIAGGTARNLRCNAYADGLGNNKGRALRGRQVEFMNFDGGSFGNAERGVDFTDGFSFGCVFTSNTLENCKWAISNRSPNSGAHTFIGPQLTEITQAEVYSSASLAGKPILIVNPNANGPTRVDPTSYQGVRIIDTEPVATPTAPASGVSFINTTGRNVIISYSGVATMTSIVVNGDTRPRTAVNGEFRVPAGATGALNYTGTLSWRWDNAG